MPFAINLRTLVYNIYLNQIKKGMVVLHSYFPIKVSCQFAT